MVDSPSIVPELALSDEHLLDALALLEQFLTLDGADWIVADEQDPIYERIPGLLQCVRERVRGRNVSRTQAARSAKRRSIYDLKAVAWAREFKHYENQPGYIERSASDQKALVGDRHPPLFEHPKEGVIRLDRLGRSQAIATIDRGLNLLSAGKYTYRSRISGHRGTLDKNGERVTL